MNDEPVIKLSLKKPGFENTEIKDRNPWYISSVSTSPNGSISATPNPGRTAFERTDSMNGLYKFFRRNPPVVVPVNDEHQLQISDQMEVPPYYVELNDNPRTEEESENEDTDKGWCNMC